ncbi:VWA domain-containing protein [Thermodesulfobacteriota bacterium]
MKSDYTHVTVILDRSGSMESIREDIIGGFNRFVADQRDQPGTATLTLVQFDTQDPYEVAHRFVPIQEIPPFTRHIYVPRASTPLLDALGRGINDLQVTLNNLEDDKKPSKVVMVIITDGQENSSREFTRDQVVKMIKDRTDKDAWQFVFLSADLGAINDAVSYGIQGDTALLFHKSGVGTAAAYASLSSQLSDYRRGKKRKMGFDPEDRKHPDDPGKK